MNVQQRRSNIVHAVDAIDSDLQALLIDIAQSQGYPYMVDVIKLRQQLGKFRDAAVGVFDDIET